MVTTARTQERPDRARTSRPATERTANLAASGGEIRALTGLRAIAAGWVVVYHFWLLTPGAHWTRIIEPIRPLIQVGWLGVDLFFVLSGFVITYTYLDRIGRRPGVRTAASFYWNRLSRVWPTWLFVTGCFTAWLVVKHLTIGGPHVHESLQPQLSPANLLQQLFMVQTWDNAWYPGSSLVGPGWSLSAEWLAYLVFPVLVLGLYLIRRLPSAVLGLGAVAAMAPFAYVAYSRGIHDFEWSWLWRIAGAFLAGALVALCVRKLTVTPRVRRIASIVAAMTIVELVVVIWWAEASAGDFGGVAVLLFPVLVGSLSLADAGPARFLSRPALVTGGRISFALYLVHIPIFEVFWTAMDVFPSLHAGSRLTTLLLPLVLVLPLPAAYGVWRYVEEPSRRAMRALSPGRRRPARAHAAPPAAAPPAAARPAAAGPAPARALDTFVPSPQLPPVPPPSRRPDPELVTS